jgi:hypothetical protein
MTPIIFGKNILRYDAAKLAPKRAQRAGKPTQTSPAPDWRTGRRAISENMWSEGWANHITACCRNGDNPVTKAGRGPGRTGQPGRGIPSKTVAILFQNRHWFVTCTGYDDELKTFLAHESKAGQAASDWR